LSLLLLYLILHGPMVHCDMQHLLTGNVQYVCIYVVDLFGIFLHWCSTVVISHLKLAYPIVHPGVLLTQDSASEFSRRQVGFQGFSSHALYDPAPLSPDSNSPPLPSGSAWMGINARKRLHLPFRLDKCLCDLLQAVHRFLYLVQERGLFAILR
jgi:hypothetical protein